MKTKKDIHRNRQTSIEMFCRSYGITREWLESPEGHLKVRRNTRHLPEGLKVGGDLILSYSRVGELPVNLDVGGTLDIQHTSISEIPSSTRIGKSLLAAHSSLRKLPVRFHIPGTLNLMFCDQLLYLPNILFVGEDLNISYTGITSIPPLARIQGDLMAVCSALRSLPDLMVLPGTLDISYSEYLNVLPEHITVGSLVMNYTHIREIPKSVTILRDLSACSSDLSSLPDNFEVQGSLSIAFCPYMRRLPEGLYVGVTLDMAGTNIQEIPSSVFIGGNLNAAGSRLKCLPEYFVVPGHLTLEGCRHLKCLPNHLSVGGTLDISNTKITCIPDTVELYSLCAQNSLLKSLPEHFILKGYLDLSGSRKILRLPTWLVVELFLNISESSIREIPGSSQIGGGIIAFDSDLRLLPDNYEVKGNLDVSYCESLSRFPRGLKVHGNLRATNSGIKIVSADLYVEEVLDLRGTAVRHIPPSVVAGRIILPESA